MWTRPQCRGGEATEARREGAVQPLELARKATLGAPDFHEQEAFLPAGAGGSTIRGLREEVAATSVGGLGREVGAVSKARREGARAD